MMFVNVSPSPVVFDETIKVLEISSIASKVCICTRVRVCVCEGRLSSVYLRTCI